MQSLKTTHSILTFAAPSPQLSDVFFPRLSPDFPFLVTLDTQEPQDEEPSFSLVATFHKPLSFRLFPLDDFGFFPNGFLQGRVEASEQRVLCRIPLEKARNLRLFLSLSLAEKGTADSSSSSPSEFPWLATKESQTPSLGGLAFLSKEEASVSSASKATLWMLRERPFQKEVLVRVEMDFATAPQGFFEAQAPWVVPLPRLSLETIHLLFAPEKPLFLYKPALLRLHAPWLEAQMQEDPNEWQLPFALQTTPFSARSLALPLSVLELGDYIAPLGVFCEVDAFVLTARSPLLESQKDFCLQDLKSLVFDAVFLLEETPDSFHARQTGKPGFPWESSIAPPSSKPNP